ncbi:MAG: purine-nucleoside phosphorylase [Bacteroidetes bacterium]|jgi:purine-nucleoside phosphorylase|nr:purine-nucleoside phosphorylase [Bacteroidota bacterium]MBT6685136.1 purine-nucleoside phosphorylase [Bacteroidota bacterium]MBT7142047.1 purine-nucleoside phosphorylase [Bacteroidota bacterium]MBT7493369.1 purine-nucleoside phosphorylase [Bacteroidota bacterium]
MLEKIKETATYIKNIIKSEPQIGVILGTGLGGLVEEMKIEHIIDYKDIPNFPVSTVKGHHSRLIFGEFSGKKLIAMQGRFHYYEGYNMKEITFPVKVMKLLGIEYLFVSNASGGVNPDFHIGDLMIIDDQINLFPENPLRGKNEDDFGVRFPDMSETYSAELIAKGVEIAKENKFTVHTGVYAGVTGPTFETPAEYKYLRIIGADAVGMSTVPEVIVAHHMRIPCFAISIITDLGVPNKIVEVTHEDVQNVAEIAEPKMTKIIKEIVSQL